MWWACDINLSDMVYTLTVYHLIINDNTMTEEQGEYKQL